MGAPTDPQKKPKQKGDLATEQAAIAARRATLATLVTPGQPVSFARRKELAEQLGVKPTTIYRDLQALAPAPPTQARVPVQVYIPEPSLADRDRLALRMLGHLRVVRADWLADLCYPDLSAKQVAARLRTLRNQQLVWSTRRRLPPPAQPVAGRATPPPSEPTYYGLSNGGLELLRARGETPEPHMSVKLHTRGSRSAPPSPAQFQRDVQVASWCASMLAALERCDRTAMAFAQIDAALDERYRKVKQDGKEVEVRDILLQADALVVARFHLKQRVHRPDQPLPWLTGSLREITARDCATHVFALHLDDDWGDQEIARLAKQYHSLLNHTFYNLFGSGGPRPLPVLRVASLERAREVATVWGSTWFTAEQKRTTTTDAHPVGVITTAAHGEHASWGVLWGTYWRIGTKIAVTEPAAAPLLAPAFSSVERWEKFCPART